MIELPWKKEDSRIQERIRWRSSGILPASPGLTQENMDHQPANNTEILQCDIRCADSVSLFSNRTTAPATNKHLLQRTQLNRQSARNKTVTSSKDFLWK
jgi:hypothetical protein